MDPYDSDQASGALATAIRDDRLGRGDVLVTPQWLHAHLGNRAVRVIEVDVNSAAYDAGHIAGAVLWNVYQDLKDVDYRTVDKTAFADLLSRSGVDAGSTVVFYGYAPAIAFWLMKLYGHVDARILDCSQTVWTNEGRPWTTDVPRPAATTYDLPDPDSRLRAEAGQVRAAIDDPTTDLIDVRTVEEFRGERFWPSGGLEPGGRAGHIPTATHLAIHELRDERGRFRSSAELTHVFGRIGPADRSAVISYCTIGARACTAWFALTYLLGHDQVRVYDGSWAEWGRLPATPVESP